MEKFVGVALVAHVAAALCPTASCLRTFFPSSPPAAAAAAAGFAFGRKRYASSRTDPPSSRIRSSPTTTNAGENAAAASVVVNERADEVFGPVLWPSSPSDRTAFDVGCVAHPVVLPPSATGTDDKWQMYYYGNPGCWANETRCFLPTGYVGLAESTDGVHWEKVVGNEEGGSILSPTGRTDDFDGLHLGVGDVVRIGENELHMYYFGGSFEGVSFGGGMPPSLGLRMRIGKARSIDGGRSWERMGQVLDFEGSEGFFASWPKIIVPDNDEKPWRMLYHAFNGTRWAVFEAKSHDEGDTWTRDGKMALGPGDSDAWDNCGVGTRTVCRNGDRELIMVYEAVGGDMGPFGGKHRFGLARWDEDGGAWVKDTDISGVPGGPILEPGASPLEPWTSLVIGTPHLVSAEDGSKLLYFCSKRDMKMNMSIGLVKSASGDLDPSSWVSVSPDRK